MNPGLLKRRKVNNDVVEKATIRIINLKEYGQYVLAKDIGAKITEISGNPDAMVTKSDKRSRPGSIINHSYNDSFLDPKVVAEYGLTGEEIISLSVKTNEELLNAMVEKELITKDSYSRHGELHLYRPSMVKLFVLRHTNDSFYALTEDQVTYIDDFKNIDAHPVIYKTNRIPSQLNDYKENDIFKMNDDEQQSIKEIEKFLLELLEPEVKRRKTTGSVIKCLPTVGQYWVRLYFKLCKATLDYRTEARDEGLSKIQEYLVQLQKRQEEYFKN